MIWAETLPMQSGPSSESFWKEILQKSKSLIPLAAAGGTDPTELPNLIPHPHPTHALEPILAILSSSRGLGSSPS